VDGVEDGEMEGRKEAEGLMDGGDDDVGIEDGIEEGVVVGRKEKLGLDVMDGTADGTPRLGSHGISILDEL